MTCLDPNSKLGRAIRSGKLRAERIVPRKGEDVADAFVRNLWDRMSDPDKDAFLARIDTIVGSKRKGAK